jgi:MoCo/4Fe-4S cofactor protein with predicted Tat translocation signal
MPSLNTQVRDQESRDGGCCGEQQAALNASQIGQTADGTPATGKTYWRSLDDLADTPEFREFVHREFPAGATEMLAGEDRRTFLKITLNGSLGSGNTRRNGKLCPHDLLEAPPILCIPVLLLESVT